MPELRISPDLSLPSDAETQTFAFVGRKGSGKTYGAGKLTELLIDHGTQVVILDSVGNWYGLRLAADGRSDGIDIPILGGLRGDIPLEATGGALIADTLVDSGRSLIIDVSQFSKADRQRFATALAERLWQRKKAERNPTTVHLVIEEAQLIVPEQASSRDAGAARMVGIFTEIIRLGRNYGIGVTMITQRPQSVSKEVLNQTECLMVFQVNGAHERKALKEWIVHQGMDVAVLNALPSLQPGHCFVWSPQWLETLRRIHIAPKRTFDSTRTPKAGAAKILRSDPKPLDLADLKEKMSATIERAKAEDPRELRRRVAELERDLAKERAAKPAAEVKTVEVPVLRPAELKRAEALVEKIDGLYGKLRDLAAPLHETAECMRASLARVSGARQATLHGGTRAPSAPRSPGANRASDRPSAAATGPRARILRSFAWWRAAGIEQPTREQLAFGARYSVNGHFNNVVGEMRTDGLVDYPAPGRLSLTPDGWAQAPSIDVAPTRAELIDLVRDQLRQAPLIRVFDALCETGVPITRADLASASGYSVNGHFNNVVGKLHTLGLADYPSPGMIALSDIFAELP